MVGVSELARYVSAHELLGCPTTRVSDLSEPFLFMSIALWQAKNALICGASAGLGRQFALSLAAQKVEKLGILARQADALDNLRQEIEKSHPEVQVFVFHADLTDAERMTSLSEEVAQSLGELDLVVNAVGKSDRGTLADLSSAELEMLVQVNVCSALHAAQTFAEHLRKRNGTLVLIGSLASLFAPRFLGGYAIAKHGVAALAQQARLELEPEGVHVLLACPGPIQREDAGSRYTSEKSSTPPEALKPGGGVKLAGLAPEPLVSDILIAAAKKKKTVVRPRRARLLHILTALWPSLAERILKSRTS